MVAPALVLIGLFLVIPLCAALAFSFTNQRLSSPEPARFVGGAQFERLLSANTVILQPTENDDGSLVRDSQGSLVYPVRETIRNNPERPDLAGLQPLFSLPWSGDGRLFVLVGDPIFLRSLFNTFYFALVVVPVQAGLGLALALLLNRSLFGMNLFRAVFFMPVVTSLVVVSVIWRFIYDGNNGVLNSLISLATGGHLAGRDWLGNASTAMPSLMAMSVWQGVGFHMVIWLAGLQNIPRHLYEAGAIDGATGFSAFRHITWPSLRPIRIFVLITITIAALRVFTQVDLMTHGGPLGSTATVVFYAVRQGWEQQNIAYGSAISLVFFVLVVSISVIQRRLTQEGG